MALVYNPAYLPLFTSKKRINVCKGGAGAGKSRAIAQVIFRNVSLLKKYKVLCLCKISNTLADTVFAELKTVIEDNEATHLFHITSTPMKIKHIESGNEILFKGLDQPNKLKSISGISMIWMEEADNFSVQDFLQANTRLRGTSEHIKQIYMSFNPTSETSWLKSAFFDEGNPYEDVSFVLETTYRDNNYIEPEDIEAMELSGKLDENFQRIYLNGEWGRMNTDGLFYKRFNSFQHTSTDVVYNDNLPVWLSFDFNVQPYCACTAWQLQPDGKSLFLFDEYTLKSPQNTTKYVCREFMKRHPQHTAGLFICGDPNGKKNDTRSEQGFNDYTIIQDELEMYHPKLRVASKAPAIVPRGGFINAIFSDNINGLKILINPSCKKTIEDLNYQKESPLGKDKKKGKVNGVIMEIYGHCSDTLDYLVCQVFESDFNNYLRGNKKVNFMVSKIDYNIKQNHQYKFK